MADRDYFDKINEIFFERKTLKATDLVALSTLLEMDSDLVQQLEKHLQLLFVSEKGNGNLCFADDIEMRPEFRTTFNAIDFTFYLLAVLESSKIALERAAFPFPNTTTLFWKSVNEGSILWNTF